MTPERLAGWREVYGRVVLERPRPSDAETGLRRLRAYLTYWFAPGRMRLDEVGSEAWKRFDGTITVSGVCEHLRERFGETVEPVEERLGRFVNHLRREGFLQLKEERR